jgi:hypothetical protein
MEISPQQTTAASQFDGSHHVVCGDAFVEIAATNPFRDIDDEIFSDLHRNDRLIEAMGENPFGADEGGDGAGNCGFGRGAYASLPVFLTSVEVAEMLRLSPRSLEKMRLEKRGPPYIRLGMSGRSKVIYRLADVEAWIRLHMSDK